MPRRLIITVVCFHITAVLFLLFGIAAVGGGIIVGVAMGTTVADVGSNAPDDVNPILQMVRMMGPLFVVYGAICILGAVGLEALIRALGKCRYWAWVVGIVVCGLQIASILQGVIPLAVLGGLGLWGLVDSETVVAFRPSPASATGAGHDADAG